MGWLLRFLGRGFFSAKHIGRCRAVVLAKLWEWRRGRYAIAAARHRSMLGYEALALLLHLANRTKEAVVEVGPYVGGATAIMALGRVHNSEAPQIAIEVGGRHDHPQLPSDDILDDLDRTLKQFHVRDRVVVIPGWSNDEGVIGRVRQVLGPHRIGMFVFDANGAIADNFAIYRPMMQENAIIVCDDYACNEPNAKPEMVRAWVDQMVAHGDCISLGVYGGTWFGRLTA